MMGLNKISKLKCTPFPQFCKLYIHYHAKAKARHLNFVMQFL
uniref:Uncharacterized protein n=1 Tax=Anguilla anguilla TaxID=7936 RepID=A0A0E9WII7_ANGAN